MYTNFKILGLFQRYKYRSIVLLFVMIGAAGTVFAASTAASSDQPSQPSINVWWPKPNVLLSGRQAFKANLTAYKPENYKLFWYVDESHWNAMPTDETYYPHKESHVDVSGWNWKASGPYKLTYVATNMDGKVIDKSSFAVSVEQPDTKAAVAAAKAAEIAAAAKAASQNAAKTKSAATSRPVSVAALPNPLKGRKLYVSPDSPAARQAAAWRSSRPADAAAMDRLAAQPTARWFIGGSQNVGAEASSYVTAARQSGTVPLLVAYNIPQRDCGSYSAGGSGSIAAYRQWIQAMAQAIGSTPSIVILEPDALSGLDCLSPADQQSRENILANATTILKQNSAATVYLDAGNSRWHNAEEMATRLKAANVAGADGFSLNVSNFITTDENIHFGTLLSQQLGGKHFVIDTGRNGAGPTADSQWCNPAGRAIGNLPSLSTGNPLVDAYLWIKIPGESDGNCDTGNPEAGAWWPDYALGLVR